MKDCKQIPIPQISKAEFDRLKELERGFNFEPIELEYMEEDE